MITIILIFIDSYMKMFTNSGIILDYNFALGAFMCELILTAGITAIIFLWKGMR